MYNSKAEKEQWINHLKHLLNLHASGLCRREEWAEMKKLFKAYNYHFYRYRFEKNKFKYRTQEFGKYEPSKC